MAFKSKPYKDVSKRLGIRITDMAAYNAKSNAQIEKAHKDLADNLCSMLQDEAERWDEALPQVLYAQRVSMCCTKGIAPFEYIFGLSPEQLPALLLRPQRL